MIAMPKIILGSMKELPYSNKYEQRTRYLEPICADSSDIEALTSYITRMAESHRLKTRVYIYCLTSKLEKYHYKNTISGAPQVWYSINGIGERANIISSLLNQHHSKYNFEWLSFLPIKYSIEARAHGLLNQNMRWCKECWIESESNKSPVYVPLAWTARLYTVCLKHNRFLSEVCPHCNNPQEQLPRIPSLIHCQHCGCKLIDGKLGKSIKQENSPEQYWFSHNIGDVIDRTCAKGLSFDIPPIPSFIQDIVDKHWRGDIGNFSKQIGFGSREAVNHWLSGKKQPSLYSIMRMSYLLQIPLYDIFCSKLSPMFIDKSIIQYKPVQDGRYKRLRTQEEIQKITTVVNQTLSDMQSGYNFISVTKLSQKLDCNIWFLRNRYPVEYAEIKSLYKQHMKKREIDYDKKVVRVISNACQNMIDNNIYPTERRLKDEYQVPVKYVRRPSAKAALTFAQKTYVN